MATNRDLLKEAIADAKTVKETAIANAKLALEEAFTPHLKSMLAAKLDEMDREDEVKESEEEEVKEADAPSWKRKNSPAGDSLDLSPRKVGTSTVQEDEESVDEEIDLDELLAELDKDKEVSENARTDAEEEGYKDGIKDEKEDLKEDERTDAEEEGYLDGEEDEKEDIEGEEDEDIDLEDMSEDDLKGFIEDVIKDMVTAGEIEPGDEFAEDEIDAEVADVDDVEIEDAGDLDVDIEIDEAKKEEIDEMTKKEKAEGDDRTKDDKPEAETEKMRKMSEDLEATINSVNELKVELNEVNLLNAKLLYTNKIFKAKNLTESKKVKVLKAFDNAKDVKQAKTIYETLSTGLIDKSINESVNRGSASKASGLEPKATSTKQPIIESNDVYNRMRKLAGLI